MDTSKTKIHLFVMDPIKNLNLELDTSLRLCQALTNLNQKVYFTEPKDLYWIKGQKSAEALVTPITFESASINSVKLGDPTSLALSDSDAIYMRKDPPFDMDYITTTWLLESAEKYSKIYNHPNSLRSLNEKLSIYLFPKDSKKAITTSNPEKLYQYLVNELDGDGILKPLNLFGGRGITRLNTHDNSDVSNIMDILKEETQDGTTPKILQKFDEKVFEGEVRAFTLFGKAIAWCIKKPMEKNFLANTRAGATLHKYTPTPEVKNRVEKISQELLRQGVSFVGFDLIDDHISEINVTSPRLLQGSDDSKDYFPEMAQAILEDLTKT